MKVFTSLEESVVRELVHHLSQNEEISLTELANECHVSKSTVVKAVKKLGYQGYNDLSQSIRLNAQTSQGGLLPRVATMAPAKDVTHALAKQFVACENKRNFCFSADKRTGSILANYVSRKLAMFEIYAPASYDYAMARQELAPCGSAFFFYHRELPRRSNHSQIEGYGVGMMEQAQKSGFSVVVFADYDHGPWGQHADLFIRIADNESDAEDFYIPRVITVFERALSAYSDLRSSKVHAHA